MKIAKYCNKPVVIEAEVYKEGMEDGWIVYFSGNMYGYKQVFKTKEQAYDFTKGKFFKYIDEDDKNFEVICEEPAPYINTSAGKCPVRNGFYIITNSKGKRDTCNPELFHMIYKIVEE